MDETMAAPATEAPLSPDLPKTEAIKTPHLYRIFVSPQVFHQLRLFESGELPTLDEYNVGPLPPPRP